ncbi:hypothetical protein [Arthrobacter sp. MP_M7]|uniref:hypothetical protein n=1 Tax=Arthrobacter sp. MP_M7 TaxID=3071716 RepID=UPI002E025BE9|nr:hypothetical protein [Arthrobacter sp. MP_M7]
MQQSMFGTRVNMVKNSLIGHGTTEVVITDLYVIATSGKNVYLGLVLSVALFDGVAVLSGDDGPGMEMPRRWFPAGR